MVEVKGDMGKMAKPQWPPGHQFGGPCKCRSSCGGKKLKYIQPSRPLSYAPQRCYRAPDGQMPNGTTYKMSYEAYDPRVVGRCRGTPVLTKENLVSAGDFSDDTTHKLSYGAWPNIQRDPLYIPKDHNLSGEGPMQEMTTHRHDFTPKPMTSVEKKIQPGNLGIAALPMECCSVMALSYKCPDYKCFDAPVSYKPEKKYIPPDSCMESSTVHKLSYMPWETPPKEDFPWARGKTYMPPKDPFDGCTIYGGSYIPPGILVEDDDGHCKGCYCLYPGECKGQEPMGDTCPNNRRPDQTPK